MIDTEVNPNEWTVTLGAIREASVSDSTHDLRPQHAEPLDPDCDYYLYAHRPGIFARQVVLIVLCFGLLGAAVAAAGYLLS